MSDGPDAKAEAAAAAAAAGYPMPTPGHNIRRRTTSHHPLETSNLTTSPPLHSGEFRKAAAAVPSPASATHNTYYYPSPTSAYYMSPTHPPQHYHSSSHSVHPQQSPSRSHSSRHHSHHHSSPHSSPKIGGEGFTSMRSPSISGASTVHASPGYHYRPESYLHS